MCHIGSGGAANSDLGCCVPGVLEILDVLGALCLFRLRGSRQNKVKCFIYGRTPECCVCVCVCGGRGKCHMRCSNKTNSEETSRVSEAAARIQDPP